ncbi:MAG: nitrilase [Solirubrobacteraceae bacterium]|jgi:aliphatic nitrilase|nr:nitrilase [Solirubrobacteraceae bacterium]MEA2276010.1 nitrilase [Solirubrobacteraceae bacterium]MEA2360476.1 nitrilase [Solirubrobacteraceae bacterium]MEA2396003.1 nitrilase [Solirubrobacteraceae bacterium]
MSTNYGPFVAAAVQAAPVYLDTDQTVQKTIGLIEEAARKDAQLIVFPESFIPGYPYFAWLGTPMWSHGLFKRWFAASIEVPGPETEALGAAARRANAYVVIGVTERDGNTAYNSLLFIDNEGRLIGKHRKLMPTHVERTVWGMGDGSDLFVLDTKLGRMSGLICWEHTMDLVRHSLYAMGEQIHCGVWVGFSNVTGWEELFNMSTELSSRYHAHVGECWVINVQNTSDQHTADILCETDYQKEWFKPGGGWSAIIAPGGPIVAGPLTDEEGILTATVDLDGILDMAHWHDAVGHYSRPDVLQLTINRDKRQTLHDVTNPGALRQPRSAEGLRSLEQLKSRALQTGDPELVRLTEDLEREIGADAPQLPSGEGALAPAGGAGA